MTITNKDEIEPLIQEKPATFMIRDDEIKAIHGMVRSMGGSVVTRTKIIKILENVVHRTG